MKPSGRYSRQNDVSALGAFKTGQVAKLVVHEAAVRILLVIHGQLHRRGAARLHLGQWFLQAFIVVGI
jgi:hypothetical protein